MCIRDSSAAAKISDGQEMMSDLVASANYRAHLCGVIAKKALNQAMS